MAMRFTYSALDERQRRLFAATDAIKLGPGGIAYVSHLLGCHRGARRVRLRILASYEDGAAG